MRVHVCMCACDRVSRNGDSRICIPVHTASATFLQDAYAHMYRSIGFGWRRRCRHRTRFCAQHSRHACMHAMTPSRLTLPSTHIRFFSKLTIALQALVLARERMRLKGDFSRSPVSLSLPLAPPPTPLSNSPLPPRSLLARFVTLSDDCLLSCMDCTRSFTHQRSSTAWLRLRQYKKRFASLARERAPCVSSLAFQASLAEFIMASYKNITMMRPPKPPSNPRTPIYPLPLSHARSDISPRLRPAMGSKSRESGPKSLFR